MSAIGDLLAQSGNPSASFPTVGTRVGGPVVATGVIQQTDIKTRQPLWWDDQATRPKNLIAITVDTGVRDPNVQDDTGRRAIYVKAWGGQLDALKAAIAQAGPSAVRGGKADICVGDTFYATYAGDEASTSPGLSPTKTMRYELTPGSAVASAIGVAPATSAAGQQVAYQQPAPVAQPLPTTPPPAAVVPPPAAPPAAPAGNPAVEAMRNDVLAWRSAGWSNEQIADPAIGASFPHAAALAGVRAAGADPVAVLAGI